MTSMRLKILATLIYLVISFSAGASQEKPRQSSTYSNDSEKLLGNAWSDFILSLKEAEQALKEPEYSAPPTSPRVLADGYRYLLGHLNREIEYQLRADPRFPEFFRSMDMLRKWTGENPDTMYLKAPIDAKSYYKLFINSVNGDEDGRLIDMPAPRMITLQTITGVPGYTGSLSEMRDCRNQTIDYITRFDFEKMELPIEILVGPSRPDGYEGLFLRSKQTMACKGTGVTVNAKAKMIAVREIFSDWRNEYTLDLSIERLDSTGKTRPIITPKQMAEHIRTIGQNVSNQIQFWNKVMDVSLEMQRDVNKNGVRSLPVNGINQPAPPFTAGGVAGAQQLYASGIFDIEKDEALLIRMTTPVEPHYIGFQLNNLWMEGPDQQNYVSSLTGDQNPVANDGSRYYIIAHRDPGIRGWVDTTGLDYGFFCFRFIFRKQPDVNFMPHASVKKVSLSELSEHLPKDIETVTEEQRRVEISYRQRHIKRRWRNY